MMSSRSNRPVRKLLRRTAMSLLAVIALVVGLVGIDVGPASASVCLDGTNICITGVSPNLGTTAGGNTVTVTGRGFDSGTGDSISFGDFQLHTGISARHQCELSQHCALHGHRPGPGRRVRGRGNPRVERDITG